MERKNRIKETEKETKKERDEANSRKRRNARIGKRECQKLGGGIRRMMP